MLYVRCGTVYIMEKSKHGNADWCHQFRVDNGRLMTDKNMDLMAAYPEKVDQYIQQKVKTFFLFVWYSGKMDGSDGSGWFDCKYFFHPFLKS